MPSVNNELEGSFNALWQIDFFNRIAQIADIRRIPEFDSKRDATHYSTMNFSELETDDDPERFKERLKMISKQKPVEGKSE